MALEVPVYSLDGKKSGTQALSAVVFGKEFNDALVHQVVVAHQANSRVAIAHAKDRSEVRGGGKKPWRQKGTGRARHGSRRSPLWSGGGVTFGPSKDQNFSKRINKKMKKQALQMVLSDKVKHDRFVVVENLNIKDPKTKQLHDALAKLPSKDKKIILVTTADEKNVVRASQNLPKVVSIAANSLNAVDLMKYEFVIVPQSAVAILEKHYA